MTVRETGRVTVAAPIHDVWRAVSDPARALTFMSGVTRWEVVSDQPDGPGARYRTLLRVGSAEIGGLIEVVEWTPPRELAWTSVTGIDQRGRWRLREQGPVATRVELRVAAGVPDGGLAGWLAERLAAPIVRGHLRRSLRQLKRQIEYDQLRARAAARRRASMRAS